VGIRDNPDVFPNTLVGWDSDAAKVGGCTADEKKDRRFGWVASAGNFRAF